MAHRLNQCQTVGISPHPAPKGKRLSGAAYCGATDQVSLGRPSRS